MLDVWDDNLKLYKSFGLVHLFQIPKLQMTTMEVCKHHHPNEYHQYHHNGEQLKILEGD